MTQVNEQFDNCKQEQMSLISQVDPPAASLSLVLPLPSHADPFPPLSPSSSSPVHTLCLFLVTLLKDQSASCLQKSLPLMTCAHQLHADN